MQPRLLSGASAEDSATHKGQLCRCICACVRACMHMCVCVYRYALGLDALCCNPWENRSTHTEQPSRVERAVMGGGGGVEAEGWKVFTPQARAS